MPYSLSCDTRLNNQTKSMELEFRNSSGIREFQSYNLDLRRNSVCFHRSFSDFQKKMPPKKIQISATSSSKQLASSITIVFAASTPISGAVSVAADKSAAAVQALADAAVQALADIHARDAEAKALEEMEQRQAAWLAPPSVYLECSKESSNTFYRLVSD